MIHLSLSTTAVTLIALALCGSWMIAYGCGVMYGATHVQEWDELPMNRKEM